MISTLGAGRSVLQDKTVDTVAPYPCEGRIIQMDAFRSSCEDAGIIMERHHSPFCWDGHFARMGQVRLLAEHKVLFVGSGAVCLHSESVCQYQGSLLEGTGSGPGCYARLGRIGTCNVSGEATPGGITGCA